jgi:hypothetical protein
MHPFCPAEKIFQIPRESAGFYARFSPRFAMGKKESALDA